MPKEVLEFLYAVSPRVASAGNELLTNGDASDAWRIVE